MNIIDLAIKSIVVSILGLVVFAMTRRSAASTRHLALTLALFSLCALPLIIPVLPAWHVPFIRMTASTPTPVLPQANSNLAKSEVTIPSHALSAPVQFDRDSSLTLLWASVATLLCLRIVTRLGRLRRLEKSLPMSAQPEIQTIVAEYCRSHGRHFLLLEGESNEPPMTWGHSRPVLLLPSIAREWPRERLQSVMLHELAHVERGDWIVSLASELVCAMFWFNPLVWVMRQKLELESELAADERVLSSGVPRTEYATHLVELLRDLNQFPKSADAAVAMARPGRLDGRIKAILGSDTARRAHRGSASIGLVALTGGVVAIVGAAGPTVVQQTTGGPESVGAPLVATKLPSPSESAVNEISVTSHPLPQPKAPKSKRVEKSAVTSHEPRSEAVSGDSPVLTLSSNGRERAAEVSSSSGRHLSIADSEGGAVSINSAHGDISKASEITGSDSENIIPVKEVQRQMDSATKEIQSAIIEANREAAKEGVSIDVSGIVHEAMKAVGASLKGTVLTKKQTDAISAKALADIRKAMKKIPSDLPDN